MGDMVVAVFTAVVLLTVATPFARHTGKVLLQTTPNVIKDRLGKSLSEVRTHARTRPTSHARTRHTAHTARTNRWPSFLMLPPTTPSAG